MGLKSTTNCIGYSQLTSLSSATALTVPVSANNHHPTLAIIVPEGQAVRWRDDDTDPTATVGMPLAVGQPLNYDGNLQNIKFIEQTSGAKLNISFYS